MPPERLRDERLHGRGLDSAACRTYDQNDKNQPGITPADGHTCRQAYGHGRDDGIGKHDQQFAVPSVNPDTPEHGDDCLRQGGGDHRSGHDHA